MNVQNNNDCKFNPFERRLPASITVFEVHNFIESESFEISVLNDSETNEPEFAFYANNNILFTTDKYGIREIWNQLDYILKEIE